MTQVQGMQNHGTTTLFRLLTEGTGILERGGNPDAKEDARQLLLAAFHLDMTHFLLNRMQILPDDDYHHSAIELYRQMVLRRRKRYPLQQILGSQEFMGFSFFVNRHVLIPRQDTETLVELVLEEQRDTKQRILDLCTGSGCIAISLALKGKYDCIVATDLSEEALKVAEKNVNHLLGDTAHKVRLLQGDLFQALEIKGTIKELFDVIISNPPYIPTAVIATLQPEVKDHEPLLALDGTADGLHFYRRITAEAKLHLKKGGTLYLEIGHDQGEDVSALLENQGYCDIRVCKDLPGNNRVVCARGSSGLEG